ncbi:hypothetical protein RvY_18774 [Ramazzottius varieornatus]|uniref:Uncharacterized protein n=1 Tax=Ramazzottius varieornatus TaxID=947166 RepID=A0A1D1W707_RAMVA|nr:hypothetical protein RvY_18774 [Ramazzottius varieornatus]
MICLLGVVGVQLFGDAVPLYFDSFSDAVFSIFICQTQRGWVRIYNMFIAAGGVVVTNLRKEMKAAQEERDRKEAKKNKTKPAVKNSAEGDEDGEEGESEEEGEAENKLEPLIAAARGWKGGDSQRRVLLPMFLNLVTLEDLQKYLFLQVALEENLTVYRQLRARLKDIYGEVHLMNESYFKELRKKPPQQMNAQPPKRRSKV